MNRSAHSFEAVVTPVANFVEVILMTPEQRERRRLTARRNYCTRNRERIAAQKREWHRKNLTRSRALNIERHRRQRERLMAGHKPAPKPIYRTLHGNSERLYRVSEAARHIGCSAGAITHRWESQGWIPKPSFDGHRLYTAEQVELLALFFSVPCHDHDKRSKVSKRIFKNWGNKV